MFWPEQVEGMEFLFSDMGKPVGGTGLLGGESRISILEKLSLKGGACWTSMWGRLLSETGTADR